MTLHLLTGDDPVLLSSALSELVHRLVGGGDRALMVDEFDGPEYSMLDVADAARTPSFLSPRRVVVARGIGRFAKEDVAPVIAYLDDPVDTTELVLVGGGGAIPKALLDALKSRGANVIGTGVGSGRNDRGLWVRDKIAAAGLRLDGAALARIDAWLGEDLGRLPALVDTLVSTFGDAARLGEEDVAPFLDDAGGVPPWDLTDAIDAGRTAAAIELVHRMMGAGGRHPMQIMSILHTHYARLLRLDGAEVHDEAQAAAAMGIKPGYPARKALAQFRTLGGGGVARAIALLARADLDLRGGSGWSDSLVMEVLVARLSRLAGAAR